MRAIARVDLCTGRRGCIRWRGGGIGFGAGDRYSAPATDRSDLRAVIRREHGETGGRRQVLVLQPPQGRRLCNALMKR